MYSGKMIEGLIKTVQEVEQQAQRAREAKALVHKPALQMESYPFFYQMYGTPQIQVGVA